MTRGLGVTEKQTRGKHARRLDLVYLLSACQLDSKHKFSNGTNTVPKRSTDRFHKCQTQHTGTLTAITKRSRRGRNTEKEKVRERETGGTERTEEVLISLFLSKIATPFTNKWRGVKMYAAK